jgi:hypothetical protein
MVTAYVDGGFAHATRFGKGELVVALTYLQMIWVRLDWTWLDHVSNDAVGGRPRPIPSHLHPISSHLHPISSHLHPISSHLHPISSHLHPIPSHLHPIPSHLHRISSHLHPISYHPRFSIPSFTRFAPRRRPICATPTNRALCTTPLSECTAGTCPHLT